MTSESKRAGGAGPASTRSRRLLLVAVVVMSLPMVIAIVALQQAHSAQRQLAGEAKLALARTISRQIEGSLGAARDALRAVANQPATAVHVANGDAERASDALAAIRESTHAYRAFAILDRARRPIAVQPLADLELFSALMGSLDPLVVQRGEGEGAFVLVRHPIVDEAGAQVGAALAAISLERLLGTVERTSFGETGAASVIDRAARVVVSSDPRRQRRKLSARPVVRLAASGGEGVRLYYAPLVARRELSAISPVAGYPLSVLVSQSEAEAFSAISLFQRALLAGLVVLSIGGAALFVLALRSYRGYERRIEASNALLEAVTEGTNDSVFVKDRDGRYLFINSAGARFIGRDREEVVGRSDFELFEPGDARSIRTSDLNVIESGELASGEFPSHDAQGVEHLFSTVRAPYRDATGKVIGVIGVARDITREHETEQTVRRQAQELARANTILAAVVEGTTDVVYVKDADERYLLMNAAGAAVFGTRREDIIGRRVDELIATASAAPIRARDREVLDTGASATGEDVVTAGGDERTFLSVVTPWRDANGRTIGLIGISRDITDRKRAERTIAHQAEELAHTNALLKGVVEGCPDAIFVKDLDGHYLMINRVGARWLEREPEQVVGRSDVQLFGPEEGERMRQRDRRALAAGRPVLLEEQALLPEGPVVLHIAMAPLRDYDGRVTGLLGIARDISERVRMEETVKRQSDELARSGALLTAVAEGTTDAVFVKDVASRIVMLNRAGAAFLGKSPEQVAGCLLHEILEPQDAAAQRAEDEMVLASNRPYTSERTFSLPIGQRTFSIVQAPWRDENGALMGLVGIARDVTEQRAARATIERQTAELARSNADLERFAYVASHDLQEPLRMVSSFVQLLAKRYRGQLDAKADEYIGYAVDGANRLQQMIEGILSLSRIGTRGRAFERVELDAVLDTTLAALARATRERGARITRTPLPAVVGDPIQLGQLLQNLVANALKFCDKSAPEIEFGAQRGEREWLIHVRDNGIGIAPEHRERVFQMLTRLHTREEYPGTGMGLAIAQKIVERHGGRIWVESIPGSGSTFRFTIPDREAVRAHGVPT